MSSCEPTVRPIFSPMTCPLVYQYDLSPLLLMTCHLYCMPSCVTTLYSTTYPHVIVRFVYNMH
jgi:hypothetical protein